MTWKLIIETIVLCAAFIAMIYGFTAKDRRGRASLVSCGAAVCRRAKSSDNFRGIGQEAQTYKAARFRSMPVDHIDIGVYDKPRGHMASRLLPDIFHDICLKYLRCDSCRLSVGV